MGFKKNERTGRFENTILKRKGEGEPDRTRRARFVKTPLLTARRGLAGFIADLLRGGPNPFLASPLAVDIDRRTGLEKAARRVGRSGDPEEADGLIESADVMLRDRWKERKESADDELDFLKTYMKEEEHWLENLKPRTIQTSLKSALDKIEMKISGDLGPFATNEAKRRLELDHFMRERGLEATTHWGKPLKPGSIYAIIGIMIGEFVLNTLFFSGTSPTGIFGGAGLALLLSVVTITLGLGFGVTFQFSGSRAPGGGWLGRALALLLFVVLGFYLCLLTLARVAGEAGDLDMFRTAARVVQERPFSGLLDLPALAYCFFTIAVIAVVYVEFIRIMGHYWGLRTRRLALNEAEDELEGRRADLIADGQDAVDEALDLLGAAPDYIQEAKRAIGDLVLDYENVVEQLRNDREAVRDASRLLVRVIRIHTGRRDDEPELTVDYEAPLAEMDQRLVEFRAWAARLEAWEDVDSATVERCGDELIATGREKLAEIERRCDEVREARYRALGGVAPPLGEAGDEAHVAWVPAAAR